MLKRLLVLAIITAAPQAAFAGSIAFEDILGRWCVSDSGNYNTFSRSQILVESPEGWKRTWPIARVEVRENKYLDIYWKAGKDKNSAGVTSYELSADKRLLLQLPNVDDNGRPVGDKGPLRQLRRC
jgi:hypothetical protein